MEHQNNQHDTVDECARGDAGASLAFPQACSALRKGGYVVIKDRPCKIVDMHTSKPGKHGHAKVSLTAIDVFTDKKYTTMHPAHQTVNVPFVNRKDYLLVDVNQYMSLMDDKGLLRADLKAPENDLGKQMREEVRAAGDVDIMVTILCAMGEESVISVRVDKP